MPVTVLLALLVAQASPDPVGGVNGKSTVAGPRPCREHPEVRPPCFPVRGRLSYWNGPPTARIWIVGTDRMLGVSDGHALPGFEQMPKNVRERMSWETELFATYTFCPFTREQPGVMQLGCIQAAEDLRAEKRPSFSSDAVVVPPTKNQHSNLIDPGGKALPPILFAEINDRLTLDQIIERLGPAHREAGSGLFILVWRVTDGREFWVATSSGDPTKNPIYAKFR